MLKVSSSKWSNKKNSQLTIFQLLECAGHLYRMQCPHIYVCSVLYGLLYWHWWMYLVNLPIRFRVIPPAQGQSYDIIVLYFLHSTSVLSFYIDGILTLSIASDHELYG